MVSTAATQRNTCIDSNQSLGVLVMSTKGPKATAEGAACAAPRMADHVRVIATTAITTTTEEASRGLNRNAAHSRIGASTYGRNATKGAASAGLNMISPASTAATFSRMNSRVRGT